MYVASETNCEGSRARSPAPNPPLAASQVLRRPSSFNVAVDVRLVPVAKSPLCRIYFWMPSNATLVFSSGYLNATPKCLPEILNMLPVNWLSH